MPKINDKNMPSYRLKGCGCYPDYKLDGSSLHDKNAIYLVSVGKDKFEGKGVERFANFIKGVQPKKLLIVLGDTLQRFNIELYENLDEKEAFKKAEARGITWKEKYESHFRNLGFDYEFIFWENIKEDNDYHSYFTEIMAWNESNPDNFSELLLESSKVYIARSGRNSYNDKDKAIEKSKNFLNEELAALRVLAKDKDTIVLFYPGAPLRILSYIFGYINKHDRKDNMFIYKELIRTKENKKENKKSKISLLKNLPFFGCDNLPNDNTYNGDSCLPRDYIGLNCSFN